jgi:hypothetical protein
MADRAVRNTTGVRIWVRVKPPHLEVLPDRGQTLYHIHRAYWDVRYTADVLSDRRRPGDPAGTTEWLTTLWDHGGIGAALRECGITLPPWEPDGWPDPPPAAVARLVADARAVLDGTPAGVGGRGRGATGVGRRLGRIRVPPGPGTPRTQARDR